MDNNRLYVNLLSALTNTQKSHAASNGDDFAADKSSLHLVS